MAKNTSERSPDRVPHVPPPSAAHAPDGMESARELARRYLPDTVRLLAGIALAPDSEAALHTRMMAAKDIVAIAGVIPQATPTAPAPAPPPPHEGP
ncbi:MAG TPA: hypothetical protein VKC66_07475 [Xanthobacteraceae bacterium]|nr:hypothetical protein [Xanthobacteraceae bacterium]